MYLYIQNTGTIGAWQMDVAYAVTATELIGEPGADTAEGKQVLAFYKKEIKDEAFYPGEDNPTVIILPLKLAEPLSAVNKHIFFSVVIKYPHLQIFDLTIGERGYKGVVSLNEDRKTWVINSKTLSPDYFKEIFDAIELGKRPYEKIESSVANAT